MPNDTNLLIIFFTGLTTGGLSCLAIQGGLLTSVIANQKAKSQILPILSFLIAKIISHTILGFALGYLGSVLTITPFVRGIFQISIAIYLTGVALAILEVHPLFRYFLFTPPKFLARLVRSESKSPSLFAPAILGALTIFIPCATTQAMEVLALGLANPLYSAAIMFAFTLGASPTFFVLGFLYSRLSSRFSKIFSKVTAALLLIMAVTSLNGGLVLVGSIYTFQNFMAVAKGNVSKPQVAGVTTSGDVQEVAITVTSEGYAPNNITIKNNTKTRLLLNATDAYSCARSFTIPSLKIQKLLPTSGQAVVEFTPKKPGPITFSCSMGMYTGTINVI